MKELIFINTYHMEEGDDKEPMELKLMVGGIEDAKNIMQMYGAFYAGDPYSVFFDGNELRKDKNGEFEPLTIDGETDNTKRLN